jgi:ABC-type branched-subunit amino acid transport system ATPase component
MLLRLEGVGRRFGGIEALRDIALDVPAGARLGLIGPNGSGKTTLLNVLSGVLPASSGAIWYEDRRIEALPSHRLARLGIARTFQNLRLVTHMTVRENVWLAQHSLPAASALRRASPDERRLASDIELLLAALELAALADEPVSSLPLPQQRRVELARALARKPRLLLLDEPAGGMTPAETRAMGEVIARLVPAETALILVEHKIDLVRRLCPRIVVLDFGRKVADGAPDAVLRRPEVAEIYFGRAEPGNA